MKKILIIFSLLFLNLFLSAQDYTEKSKVEEKIGWNFYFEKKYISAKDSFVKALKFDKKNELAKVGLMLSSENEKDFPDDMDSFFEEEGEERKDSIAWFSVSDIFLALYIERETEKMLSQEELEAMELYDEGHIYLKSALLESPFEIKDEEGIVRQKGQFKNFRPIGSFLIYDYESRLLFEYIYPETGNIVIENQFTNDGKLAKQIITIGDPLHGNSSPIKETVFWQKNVPGQRPEYLFVSENGFIIYDKNQTIVLDENTPDNLIEKVYENREWKNYIWKDGKRNPYIFCEEDGHYSDYDAISGVKTEYKWENCKKIVLKVEE